MQTGERPYRHRLARLWRSAFAAGFLALAATPVPAAPDQDFAAEAATIQTLIDADRAADAETAARTALAEALAALGAESLAVADLNRLLGDALYLQGRYAEAEPHFRAALAIRGRRLGEQHADTAQSASDLALTLRHLGQYAEAAALHRLVIDIRTALLGEDHGAVADSWFSLARTFDAGRDHAAAAEALGRAVDIGRIAYGAEARKVVLWIAERGAMLHDAGDMEAAEPLYLEALATAEREWPADDTDLATFRQSLATLYRQTGRPALAEPLHRRALAVREAAFGGNSLPVVLAVEGLGRALEAQGRNGEAVDLYLRALAIRQVLHGTDSASVADMHMRAGSVLLALDRAREAEAHFFSMLAIHEATDGAVSVGAAHAARNIARAMSRQDRAAEAETYLRRALDISEAIHGPDDVYTGFDVLFLGMHYAAQQRFREAAPLLERSIGIMDGATADRANLAMARTALAFMKFAEGAREEAISIGEQALADIVATRGRDHRNAAAMMVTLAQMRELIGDFDEAERLAVEARAILEADQPRDPSLIKLTTLMGEIRLAQGRPAEAERFFRDAAGRLSARFGADSTELQSAHSDLGKVRFVRGDFADAVRHLERSARLIEKIAAIDAGAAFAARTGEIEDAAIARGAVFDHLVKAYDRLAGQAPERRPALTEKAFVTAQRVIESEAAAALSQLALRQAAGDGALAALVRERQDLVERWREEDAALVELLSLPPGDRDAAAEAALRERLAAADRRIAAIDRRLADGFPQFAELQRPEPLGLDAVRERLAADEVLLFFADTSPLEETPGETYLWAVAKDGAPRWVRLARPAGELHAEVRHLRGQMGVGPVTRGAQALGASAGGGRSAAVLAAAHSLYEATLAPVADMIEGRRLIVVPSRRLASLPFHLLVSDRPDADAEDPYRAARWLARDHAITVLPSVSALGAVSAAPVRSNARRPYLGFANPLLTGRTGDDRRAFGRDSCAPSDQAEVLVAAAEPADLASLFRGATADVAAVRSLAPLPETIDEACAIAAALGAGEEALRIGAAATESEVKRLSLEGDLATARIVHFATHGLVSGELDGLAEPAIVLTPPDAPSAHDDGLLTASEVTTLKLDADWVILSACNTASGDGGGEALSGLARAFFYAGARALMVSHWPVNSDAAVRLATGAIDEIANDATVDRAEALRRAMVAEIDRGGRHADPANWAPFILVGAAR